MYESFLTAPTGLFDELERFRRELSGSVGRPSSIRAMARGSYPAVNVGSTPEAIEIHVYAPGLARDKIDVSVEKGVLTVSGERNPEPAPAVGGRDERRSVYAQERFFGRWRRVVSLPDDADAQGVEATYRDGLLHVSVKRRAPARPQRIQVQ